MNRRLLPGLALAAVLAPVLLYGPTLRFGFVFDDRPLLIDNPIVQAPRGVGELFTTDLDPRARTSEAPTTNYLRPLFLGTAVGLHRLWGDDPRGWHATAVLLHGALAGLAFVVLRRETAGALTATAAALLFAFHPAHVQSAAWVSGLQDLLHGITALGAFLVYRRSRREPVARGWALAQLGFAFALALLAKEPAIGLLFWVAAEAAGLVPAAPAAGASRRPRAELLVLAAVAAAYFAYRWVVLGGLAHAFPTAPPWPVALASVPVALLVYLQDLLWPVGLFLLHPARPVPAMLSREALLAASGLLVVLLAVGVALRRWPAYARPAAWTAAWIAPVLALWAVNPEWMVMDRYLLLPTLGLAWAVALACPLEARRTPARQAGVVLLWLALLSAGAALSLVAMRPFANEDAFWSAAVRADPASSTAWTEWARRRAEAGDRAGADEALRRAVALDPRAQLPRLRQALLALDQGAAPAAVRILAELVERNPAYLPAWRNLVVAKLRAGDEVGALTTLDQALIRFADDPVLWTHRGVLLRGSGRLEEALLAIRRAVALAPGDATLALREALLAAELGRGDEAKTAARRGLGLMPEPPLRARLEALAR